MRLKVISILFSISSFNLAALETIYKWENSNSKAQTGKCYEIDKETKGKKFSIIVKNKWCKPQSTYYTFDYNSGHCFEVDTKTGVKGYFSQVEIDNCKTMPTTFNQQKVSNKKTNCYEVDKLTMGTKFYKKIPMKNCINKEEYFWKSISQSKGECWYQNSVTGQKTKVEKQLCRPRKVRHIFLRLSPLSGNCYEAHPKGTHLYVKKVKLPNCKPKSTIFVFYIPEGKKAGYCYEIDAETRGDLYIRKVEAKNCK